MITWLPSALVVVAAIVGLALLAFTGPTVADPPPTRYSGRAPVQGRPSITPTARESR